MENQEKTNEEVKKQDEIDIIRFVDNEVTENEEKKKGLSLKTQKIIGIVIAVLVVVYLGVAMYFSDKFLFGTIVNGIECAGMTLTEVEDIMKGKVSEYSIVIEEANDVTEEIKGTDIELQYNGVDKVGEAFENQNSFGWIASLVRKNVIEAKIDVTFNEEKMTEKIQNLNCMKEENQISSTDAKPLYSKGTFEIQEETYGTVIDQEKFNQLIRESISLMNEKMNLTKEQCYLLPKYTKDSKEVLEAQSAMNKCLETKLTYSLDGATVTLDKETISTWLSVDEEMKMVISSKGLDEFVNTLASTFNTSPRTNKITTPTGKTATVKGATVGRSIGKSAERERILEDVQAGKVETREPVIAQQATPAGEYAWGNTYVEVDLSAQHMWYIKGGSVILQTDVVTGKPPSNTTPSGVYEILEKKLDKTLRGDRQPNGEWGYETPVDYWMRVTWSGIGFHDATWQSSFGGSRYLTNGSHGCINMPLAKAKELYSLLKVGCPVIIHY